MASPSGKPDLTEEDVQEVGPPSTTEEQPEQPELAKEKTAEPTKEDVQDVQIHLIGEESAIDPLPVKHRADEVSYWDDASFSEPTEKREGIEKAEESQTMPPEGESTGPAPEVLEPPLPLSGLVSLYEESNSLRQNVDAMVTNVDGYGFTLVPSVPLKGRELRELIRDQMALTGSEPSEADLDARIGEIQREAAVERRRLKSFFAFSADESFTELRRKSREDMEVLGNWAWEVLRDDEGNIARFVQVPFYTTRITREDEPQEVTVKRKVDPVTYEEFKEERRFRRFVQIVEFDKVWFKEFGDPRLISKKDGRIVDEKEMAERVAQDPEKDGPATEILHYKIHAIRGEYGLPRWIGNLPSIRGSRLAEEVNLFYFHNKAIPPMIIFVENGRLQSGAVKRLTDFMNQVKGDTQKFWRIAVLEGESGDAARKRGVSWSGNAKFKIEKLSTEQLQDALFQNYDERNRDKVGESFRLPRLLRGDVRDFNRATAQTAKAFAEEQVFQPERDRFDAWINRILGPELDMKYWEFKSLSSIVRDPFALTEMTEKLVKSNVLIPAEGREIAQDIFNREFDEIEEPWTQKPIPITLSTMRLAVKGKAEEEPTLEQVLDSFTKNRNALGLGRPGEAIDLKATVTRLLEIQDALTRESVLPDEEED